MSRSKPTYVDNTYRELAFNVYEQACVHCGERDNLVAHHIDGDQDNSSVENLIVLCRGCHQAVHGYKAELPEFLNLLRSLVDDDSLSFGPIQTRTKSVEKQLVKVGVEKYETLEQIANEHDYGSLDEAISHALREAGYDV